MTQKKKERILSIIKPIIVDRILESKKLLLQTYRAVAQSTFSSRSLILHLSITLHKEENPLPFPSQKITCCPQHLTSHTVGKREGKHPRTSNGNGSMAFAANF